MTSANLSDPANYPDSEGVLQEYERKCHLLKTLKKEKISVRQSLLVLCERNDNISKRLLKVKKEYETLQSDLHRTLYHINVAADKRKILSRKQLNEYVDRRRNLELQHQRSPVRFELEELIKLNDNLIEQCRRTTALLDLTKKQYTAMVIELQKNFEQKVCEFCDLALKLNVIDKSH